MADDDVLERCRRGDGAAWREVVSRYERLVYSIPRRLGLGPVEAADVAQATFATLIASLAHIEHPDRLASWLGTVARRESYRVMTASRRTVALDDGDERAQPTDPDDAFERLDRALWIHGAVHQLGEPCRTLLEQLFFDRSSPSYDDVAQRMMRPVGSIGPMRSSCLARLRHVLEPAEMRRV